MTWTVAGALVLAYQLVAVATGRRRVSRLSCTWPWSVLVWGIWLSYGAHFVMEGRRD